MNTHDLNEALHAHFIRPDDQTDLAGAGAVYLTEVTAPNSSRRADAVHIGLWSSRGAGRVDVCELKVSRADFRRELDKPEKAEAWWPYCNAFWIVAPSTDVAPPEELPPGWGLMVPGGRSRRFKVVVKPDEHEARITVPLLITLLKNTETTRTNSLRRQDQDLRKEFWNREQEVRRERGHYGPKDKQRLERLGELEKLLGVELADYSWNGRVTPQTAAEGLQTFMRGQAAMESARQDAKAAVRELERMARTAQKQADDLRKVMRIKQ